MVDWLGVHLATQNYAGPFELYTMGWVNPGAAASLACSDAACAVTEFTARSAAASSAAAMRTWPTTCTVALNLTLFTLV